MPSLAVSITLFFCLLQPNVFVLSSWVMLQDELCFETQTAMCSARFPV